VGLTERRIKLLFAIFLGLLVVAVSRTLWLGGVRASSLQRAAATQQVDEIVVPASRGAISDRNGIELAVSQPAADVAATPYLVKHPAKVAGQLAPLLGQTEAEVLKKLGVEGGFVYLARNLPGAKAEKIKKLHIEGLQFIPGNRRDYPRKWLASQAIGGVGVDGEGLSGLEYRFDKVLHGTAGKRRIVKDALGAPIVLQETKRSVPGKDIKLTLDAQLQGKVEDVLAQVGAKWHPKGATAVVMDPRTSTILAVADWPRVDANDLGGAPAYASQNRAVSMIYEPGSTFKAFTVAGALEDKRVTPDEFWHLPPSIQVADRTIEEAHARGAVDLTTSQILAQSSNVGTVRIAERLGADRFDYWTRRFGFGRRTKVDLPGEEPGLVLARKKYTGPSMGNLPIGQGNSVTPMQLATAYAAIANGGVLRRPRIVSRVGDRATKAPAGRRIISEATTAQVRSMLTGVFEAGGTASQIGIDGYTLAGKTGTANKIDDTTGEYSQSRYVASFVGFAPARDPKLLVTVMVDEPQGDIYGAQVAAPAFQEIMRFALPYLRIPPG
jgi:cell division protein FtsI (penicillin-binding protein 3)